MTSSFARHGIDHLSASSLNLWAAQPALWIMERLLGRRIPTGIPAARGKAVEHGVHIGLIDPAKPADDCAAEAEREFNRLTALAGDPRRDEERPKIGGYVRYDYKTATKLLEVCDALMRDYGGNLDVLHDAATDPRDLENRLKALGKGIGDTTVGIFLRELRGIWSRAEPPLSPLALAAATALGYLTPAVDDADRALVRLQKVWTAGGQPASVFAEFEAALVREGLRLRHQAMRHRTA